MRTAPETDNAIDQLLTQLVALASTGQLAAAEIGALQAVARYPAYPDAHNNLSNVLRARHLTNDALNCFMRALELKPDFAEASGNAGAACLDFHETTRTVSTAGNWQVRQKMHRGSVERWRNYAEFVKPLRRLIAA
jgi:tetratricopeptide (TPR) repeat protein